MSQVPPPFDPELAATLAVMQDVVPPGLTPEEIETGRQGPGIQMLDDLDVTLDGFFEAEDRTVPGP
jgi:hypothetical protein